MESRVTSTAVRQRARASRNGTRRDGRSHAGADRREGARHGISLDDKYVLEDGRILLTGVQGLVRLPLDQHRADRRRGLSTATMISGYQGSPLGGLDQELTRNKELAREYHVHHVPGLNEELGATSAWGSQLASDLPGARYDGVLADVVRQGAGARPRRRLAASRQLRRRLPHGRCARRRGRRPELQVLHDPECLRADVREPAHARLLPGQRAGGARPRAARARLLARVRALGRLQGRHQRGGRPEHGGRGAGAHRGRSRPP